MTKDPYAAIERQIGWLDKVIGGGANIHLEPELPQIQVTLRDLLAVARAADNLLDIDKQGQGGIAELRESLGKLTDLQPTEK